MTVFVVIGEVESVYQSRIGGDFESSYDSEIVSIFKNKNDAESFIAKNKLKKPIKESYSGKKHYKTGHFSLEIEEHTIVE